MLTVVCVEAGNYLGRGAEYVAKLQRGVARHLSAAYRFVCLTDDPARQVDSVSTMRLPAGLMGWWAKVALFEPGRFEGRVLYIDLDAVITGPLDALTQAGGLIHLADWGWTKSDYGSGVMVWDAGEHTAIWTRYSDEVPRLFRGDQDWLTALGGWARLPPPPVLCSYRYHCRRGLPAGASIVSFHGRPKPHELGGWVRRHWR